MLYPNVLNFFTTTEISEFTESLDSSLLCVLCALCGDKKKIKVVVLYFPAGA